MELLRAEEAHETQIIESSRESTINPNGVMFGLFWVN